MAAIKVVMPRESLGGRKGERPLQMEWPGEDLNRRNIQPDFEGLGEQCLGRGTSPPFGLQQEEKGGRCGWNAVRL